MVADNGRVNIHGKEYKTVALRVSEFRGDYSIRDGWAIRTTLISADEHAVIMQAEIVDPEGRVVAQGHAEEVRDSSKINRTSALENAETSAVGRALAAAGLAGSEYASADEVARAIQQQRDDGTGKINAAQAKSIYAAHQRTVGEVDNDKLLRVIGVELGRDVSRLGDIERSEFDTALAAASKAPKADSGLTDEDIPA